MASYIAGYIGGNRGFVVLPSNDPPAGERSQFRFCRDIESVGLDLHVTVISTTRVFQLQKPCRCRSSALIPLSRSDRRLEPIVSQTAIPHYGSIAWWEEQR